MVKQEIYKINDFFTLAGWRRPIYLNKFGQACWAAPKWEKQTDKKNLCNSPQTHGTLEGIIQKPLRYVLLSPSQKKISSRQSNTSWNWRRACKRVVCRGNKSAFYRMEATKRVLFFVFFYVDKHWISTTSHQKSGPPVCVGRWTQVAPFSELYC